LVLYRQYFEQCQPGEKIPLQKEVICQGEFHEDHFWSDADFQKKVDNRLPKTYKYREYIMKDIIIILGILAVWFLLQAYILPKLGVST
jgi:hypothetical protein